MMLTIMLKFFKNLWFREGGYRELLVTAFPLILSTASWSVLQFADRMFLTWYSPETVAASMPAGILNFTLTSLFLGTASYTGTFVAQYYGAAKFHKIG
jgi:MATE family multidrug resistance protein